MRNLLMVSPWGGSNFRTLRIRSASPPRASVSMQNPKVVSPGGGGNSRTRRTRSTSTPQALPTRPTGVPLLRATASSRTLTCGPFEMMIILGPAGPALEAPLILEMLLSRGPLPDNSSKLRITPSRGLSLPQGSRPWAPDNCSRVQTMVFRGLSLAQGSRARVLRRGASMSTGVTRMRRAFGTSGQIPCGSNISNNLRHSNSTAHPWLRSTSTSQVSPFQRHKSSSSSRRMRI
mmetsp:Transcript_4047/g.7725  ORF Transcript_4047/g.7725 Transcript_4047/m.7725 type:complete len:233 (+) Transcript_4047:323-1021(+)